MLRARRQAIIPATGKSIFLKQWPTHIKDDEVRSIGLTELSRSDTINLIADAIDAGLEFTIGPHPSDKEQIELRIWKS